MYTLEPLESEHGWFRRARLRRFVKSQSKCDSYAGREEKRDGPAPRALPVRLAALAITCFASLSQSNCVRTCTAANKCPRPAEQMSKAPLETQKARDCGLSITKVKSRLPVQVDQLEIGFSHPARIGLPGCGDIVKGDAHLGRDGVKVVLRAA